MSSSTVRTAIAGFINSELPSEKLIDLSGDFRDLNDLLNANSVTGLPWLGIQYVGNPEEPIGLTANNTQGKYLETGVLLLHVVGIAALSSSATILSRAEALRNKFRGQRIGNILIESMTTPNFEAGNTISFEAGYSSATVMISYSYRFDL